MITQWTIMYKFFKREFGPYFRDFSEYDFRFFRTFRDSFLRPTKVIEANDGSYTGELKFTFNVFTVLFFIYYIYNPSWVEGIEVYNLWRYPLPHQRYLRIEQSIEEDYNGYIMAVAFIPIYFVILKLLFYKRKPWGFFLSASFYLTSTLFTLLFSMIFILNVLEVESEIIVIPAFLSIILIPVISMKLQHWFWSSIKAVIAALVPIIFSSLFLTDILSNLVLNLTTSEKVLEMKPDNQLVLIKEQLPIEPRGVQQITLTNEKDFAVLGFDNLSWIKEGHVIKEIPLTDYYNKKIVRIGNGPYLVACFHENDEVTEQVLTLYSSSGDTLANERIESKVNGQHLSVRKFSNEQYAAFVNNIRVNIRQKEQWDLSVAEPISNDDRATKSYTTLSKSQSLVQSIQRAEHHVLNFQVAFIDSLDQNIWMSEIYQKKSPFDPLDLLMTHIDTAENIVYTHYTLANDSAYFSYLTSIDISSGELMWENKFTLQVHVTEYEGLIGDEEYLYLYGEAHKFYSEWFWQPVYHIGLVVKIERATGEYVNHIFLGPDANWNAHSRVHALYPKDNLLHLITFDKRKEALPWEDVDDLVLKIISKDF